MSRPGPSVLALWILLLVTVVMAGACSKSNTDHQYGRKRVVQYDLSAEQITAFTEFATRGVNNKPLDPVKSLTAETKDWIGPPLQVDRESGPYTVVVTVKGKSRYKGDVSTLWNTGWGVDGVTRSTAFPGLAKLDAKEGQALELVKAAPPVRFKDKQTVSFVLSLVKTENIDLESVKVEIWSGIADYSWGELLLNIRWFALGLIVLLLRYFWVRR